MFNKRLIQAVPAARDRIMKNVLFQWLGLLCSAGSTLLLCALCSSWLQGMPVSIWPYAIGIVLLLLVRSACTHLASRQALASSHAVKRKLRKDLFEKVAAMGPDYLEHFSSAEIAQLCSEGAEQLESYFANYLPQFFYALIAPVTLFLLIVFWDWKAALALLICVPLIPASIVAVQKFAKKLLNKYWGQYTGLSDSFLENLQGLTTLKVYGADERAHQQMNEQAENFRKVTMRVLIMQLNSISVMDLVAYGGSALGIALALIAFQNQSVTLFKALSIVLLSAEFFLPMRLLGSYFHISMNGSAAADKMFAILDTPVKERSERLQAGAPVYSAENLTFSYDGEHPVLKDLSFTLPATGLVGICGESGSGKSTLAGLLSGRLSDPSGKLLLKGQKVDDLSRTDLSDNITTLTFESTLFSGTVADNLRMAKPDATEEEMIDALKRAGIWSDLMAMEKLDTPVSEQGGTLSGGQRQRVAFARALLKNSDVLILDEATSSVDGVSEEIMMEQIRNAANDRLVICISHRLANVKPADSILVFENGSLVGQGVHEDLMETCDSYRQLYNRQQQLEAYTLKDEQEDLQ